MDEGKSVPVYVESATQGEGAVVLRGFASSPAKAGHARQVSAGNANSYLILEPPKPNQPLRRVWQYPSQWRHIGDDDRATNGNHSGHGNSYSILPSSNIGSHVMPEMRKPTQVFRNPYCL